ncbi:MAG: efflux transporter outer membrane subunit [Burkholderiales bacterium]|nr:efflux transporter outer membrane subunit [Burkholderiales bacterium]
MRALVASLAVALLVAGCALAPPPPIAETRQAALPQMVIPPRYAAQPSPAAAAGEGAASIARAPAVVTDGWIAAFHDPTLVALVAEAIAYNSDLRIAQARVEQAQAYLKIAGATLYPQVSVLGRGGGKMSDSSGLSGIGVFVNWELDLWGRVRSGQAFAQAQYDAAQLDAEYARQSVAALVAKGWFLATEARLQQAQASAMREAATKLADLAQERGRVGRGDELDVALAQAAVASLRDTERALAAAYQQAVRGVETLVGRYPAASLEVPVTLAAWPGDVPVGLPSELLERRPDVVAAERRVAGAFHRTEEAKAARLPRITLTASITTISSELFFLKSHDNPVWSLGAGLLQPIFLGGQLQGQVEVRTAEQQQAVAEYGRIGARAFAEVEESLSNGYALADREALLATAVRENARALDLAGVRYRVGVGDLRAVQQQQLALHAAQVQLLRVQAERRVQRVNLHLALGGSFDAPSQMSRGVGTPTHDEARTAAGATSTASGR